MKASPVLILDAGHQPINMVTLRKGINYITSDKGYSLMPTNRLIGASIDMEVPSIIVLNESHAHRSHGKNGVPKWSKKKVLQRDGHKCAYCLNFANTVDHIVPKALGGKNEWMNTVAACFDCNNKKGDKTLAECGMKLKFQPFVPIYLKPKLMLNREQREFLIQNGYEFVLQ